MLATINPDRPVKVQQLESVAKCQPVPWLSE